MLLSALQSWLDGERDFAQGAQLYAQHPDARPALVSLVHRGATGAAVQRQLVHEVEQLLAASPATDGAAPAAALPATEAVATATAPLPDALAAPEQEPEEVRALAAEKLALFKQSSHLHGTLLHLATTEERRLAAVTILTNFERGDEIWDALKYHKQHGALPPQLPPPVLDAIAGDVASWTRKRNNLRTYFSGKRGTPEKRALWAAELAELERRLAQ